MLAALPLLTAAYVTGIVLYKNVPLPLAALAVTALLAAACSLMLITAKKRAAVPLLFLFLLLGMLSLSTAERQIHGPVQDLLGHKLTLSGSVREADYGEETVVILLQANEVALPSIESRPLSARIRVRVYAAGENFKPAYGDRLQLHGVLMAAAGRRNPGGFDFGGYLEGQGVGAVMSVRAANVVFLPGSDGHAALFLVHALRERVVRAINAFLSPGEAGLARGVLLGERRHVDVETVTAYQALGIAHLLAVSGLHVGFVAAFALFISGRIFRKRGGLLTVLPAVVLILGYVLLTGGRPPVWRAALMFYLALTAKQAGRESEGLQALYASALVLLFFRPYWLFSLSFQFSFLATAGIILLTPRLEPYFARLPSWLAVPLSVTLAAQLTILPLQAVHFGNMSLLAVPANLLCVPLVGAAMLLGLAGALAGIFVVPVAAPFFWAALPLLTFLNQVPVMLASLPFATLSVHTVQPFTWLCYYALLGLFARRISFLPLDGKKVMAILLVAVVFVWSGIPAAGGAALEVTFLDVGQGLAMHIKTPAGRHLLVDAGGRPGFCTGERTVVPYLRHRRVTELDALILTHPHFDHYGGMAAVAQNLRVRHFISSGDRDEAEAFAELERVLLERDVALHVVDAGSRIVLEEGLILDVLAPPHQRFRHTGDDVNNNSLVIRLAYHEFSLLITGDAETEAIAWLVREQGDKLQSTVLQVPHHGSGHTLTDSFLERLDAQAAVIPVGKNNFGHPHPQTLEILLSHGISVYRTDLHGSVTVRSDGRSRHIFPLVKEITARPVTSGETIIDSSLVDIIP